MSRKYKFSAGADLYVQKEDGTEVKVITSSGELLYKSTDLGDYSAQVDLDRTLQSISSAQSSTITILGYGVTVYQGDTGASLQMNAPSYAGVRKTIIFTQGSSIARSISSTNTAGSTGNNAGFSFYSPAATNSSSITLSTGSTVAATLELLGLTTVQWYPLISHSSTPVFTVQTT